MNVASSGPVPPAVIVARVGTFNNWSRKVQMHRSGNDFVYIGALTRAKHCYKFIVDDEWRYAADQNCQNDTGGNINNFIDLTTFTLDDDWGGWEWSSDGWVGMIFG